MPKTITRAGAVVMVLNAVNVAAIGGLRPRDATPERDARSGAMRFNWERSFKAHCDLEVNLDGLNGVEVCVGWSSTGRSPSAARASVVLYSAVTDLACLIESMFEGLTVDGR